MLRVSLLITGLFEVQMKTPPKESLGIHAFHPNTANGDCIEVDGKVGYLACSSLTHLQLAAMRERNGQKSSAQKIKLAVCRIS